MNQRDLEQITWQRKSHENNFDFITIWFNVCNIKLSDIMNRGEMKRLDNSTSVWLEFIRTSTILNYRYDIKEIYVLFNSSEFNS